MESNNNLSLEIDKCCEQTNNFHAQTNNFHEQINNFHEQTNNFHEDTANLRKQTDKISDDIKNIHMQLDELMLIWQFDIDLKECFIPFQQFISPKSDAIKHKFKLPIRAYCPTSYRERCKIDNLILREIHIKILDLTYYKYYSEYDLDEANDILKDIIQSYKQDKQILIIAQDDTYGNKYWYFQLYVSENQECIDLAKQIVSKWLQIIYKQPISHDIHPIRP